MKKLLILVFAVLIITIGNSVIVLAQDEVKENPNAPANYDANLSPGVMAIGIYSGSPETVKIVSKSGGVYKAMSQESPNPYEVYYKANSVYPYFNPDKLTGLVSEYTSALEPYVELYATKHGLSQEVLKGDGFQFNIGHSDANELKTRLERELPKLAQLESRLGEIGTAFPETYAEYRYNPALVKEIATRRNEYFREMMGQKDSLKFQESVWLMAHRDGIAKSLKAVESYDPATKTTMGTYSEYVFYAVSPKMREQWLKEKNALDFREPINTLLKPLADALAKKLPTYFPKMQDYAVHNPAEEAMMRRVLTNPARYKIFKSGLMQTAWLIDKNSLGIPTARYKNGVIYLRDTQSDHPYCYATYVNIVQSYAGGGTYAASRPVFIQDEVVGCPAGAN